MYLVDTSYWIELIRKRGDAATSTRVVELMKLGQAAWCDMVRLELWNGASSDYDIKAIHQLEAVVPSFVINAAVWDASIELSRLSRVNGLTIPANDLVIAACARCNGAEVESRDNHFKELAKLR